MPTTIPIDLTVKNMPMYLGTVIAVVREELARLRTWRAPRTHSPPR
jgi:hypothetical protein